MAREVARPGGQTDPVHMRAADADRQKIADQLKAALDEGRLSLHEYDERVAQAYAALREDRDRDAHHKEGTERLEEDE